MHFDLNDKDETNSDGLGAAGAIILPPLAPGAKFNITSTMIQPLNLKRYGDDSNMHLMNFIGIYKSFNFPRVSQNTIRLRLFLLSLYRDVTL